MGEHELVLRENDYSLPAFSTYLGVTLTGGEAAGFRDLWTRSRLDGSAFARRLADYMGLPFATLDALAAAPSLAGGFTPRFLREFGAYPFTGEAGAPSIAVAQPPPPALDRAAEMVLGRAPDYVIASFDDIDRLLVERARATTPDSNANGDGTAVNDDDVERLRDLASGEPVVRALDDLFEKANEWRATDLHIEPMRDALVVRFRVDGILRPAAAPPRRMARAIISRLKNQAGFAKAS